MRQLITPSHRRRGITVLGLLLLIIALVAAAVFLVRYLRSRPAAVSVVTALVIPSEALSFRAEPCHSAQSAVIPSEARNLLHRYREAAG